MLKNWRFWTVVLEKSLESPLHCKEIQSVNPKGNQSWIFVGRTDAETEAPILWPPNAKSWLVRKDQDAGKDWGQEKEGDDRGWDGWMASPTQWAWVWVGSRCWWWTGGLACYSPWGQSQRVRHSWTAEQQQQSERSQSEKSTYYLILTICHAGKDKTKETVKRSVLARGWGRRDE